MKDKLIEFLSKKVPESEELDYKEAISDDIGKDLAAMANGKGGFIVFGVKDDDGAPGEIVGLMSYDTVERGIQSKAKDTVSPPVKIETMRVPHMGKRLLIVSILPSRYPHVYWSKNTASISVRRGSMTVPMSKELYDAKVSVTPKKSARAGKPVKQYKSDIINHIRWEWDYDHNAIPVDLTPLCVVCQTRLTIKDDINPPKDKSVERGLETFCPQCNKGFKIVRVFTKRDLIEDHVIPKIENAIRKKTWKDARERLSKSDAT